jgi:hypothetical protein
VRFSITNQSTTKSNEIGVIKLCQDCWQSFMSVLTAADELQEEKLYVDDPKVVRTLDAPIRVLEPKEV